MAFIKWGVFGPHRCGPRYVEWLSRGDLLPHGDAVSWGCPWCGYSVLFWPKDEIVAEETARSHMLNQHGYRVWREGRMPRQYPEEVSR